MTLVLIMTFVQGVTAQDVVDGGSSPETEFSSEKGTGDGGFVSGPADVSDITGKDGDDLTVSGGDDIIDDDDDAAGGPVSEETPGADISGQDDASGKKGGQTGEDPVKEPSGEKTAQPEDGSGEKDPSGEKKDDDPGSAKAAPGTRSSGVNWELADVVNPSDTSSNIFHVYGGDVTYEVNNGTVTSILEIDVVPTRSDYYQFWVYNENPMNSPNPNTSGSYRFAKTADVTVTDSNGNVLMPSHTLTRFTSTLNHCPPVLMRSGEHYTLRMEFHQIHSYYYDIEDTTRLVDIICRTVHNYVNGKCVCFDEHPDDIYSHINYRLATGREHRPDFVYVYQKGSPETRMEVYAHEKVFIDGELVSDFDTTANHLRNDNEYDQSYLGSYNTFLPNANSNTYVEITMWVGNKSLVPIRFKLYLDPDTYELKSEVISGKGSVRTFVMPLDAVDNGYMEPPIGWTGSDFAIGLYYSYSIYDYEPGEYTTYMYWDEYPVTFSDPLVRRGSDGTYEVSLVDDQGVHFYVPMGLGSKYYYYGHNYYYGYPILYYALAVELEKPEAGDAWSGIKENPLSIETFDIELSDVTDDTATVTVSGKLSRDLIDRKADEETLSFDYKEELCLSVADKIVKISEADVGSDGSFTLTLEGATLDANIVLATKGTPATPGGSADGDETEYTYGYEEMGYETLYVPLLRMPVSKVWTDSEGNTGDDITARHKDDTVVVDITADGEILKTVELNTDTDPSWETVIKGLPEYTHYERGKKPATITYKATEREIIGYNTSYGEEESSKYLTVGEKITEEKFSGKYIMLSEAAKMALSVEDGKVVAKPYDTDDEYQKWSTVAYTYANAYIGVEHDESNDYYRPVFGDYDVLFVKNDKTGLYLAITPSGPVLIDEDTAHTAPEAAIYVVSPTTGNAIIRSVGYYDNGNPINYGRTYVHHYNYNYGYLSSETYGYWYVTTGSPDQLSFTLIAHQASVPSKWYSFYEYSDAVQGYIYRYVIQYAAVPWKFLALHWSDAEMKQVYTVTSTSSTLVNVSVFDEQNGLLYKVVNTPNSITVEKELEFESGNKKTVDEDTFYITLFSDAARTKRVADVPVQQLKISDSSSGKVVFEGIPYGTYYVGETDMDGFLIDGGTLKDGSEFVPEYGNYTVTISADDQGGANYSFKNIVHEDPNTADIVVTKKLVDKETGKDVNVEGKYTVYVALFADEAHTMRVSGIEKIDISGSSSGTAVFKDIEEGTYYVGETDANGNKLVAAVLSPEVGFVAEYSEGDKVEIKGDTEKAEVTFTNQFETPPEDPPEDPEEPPVDPPEDPEEPPKTDDLSVSWFNTWVVSGLLLAGSLINLLRKLKKKEDI